MTSREYTEIVATIAVEQDQDKLERIVTMAKSAIQTLKRRELRQEFHPLHGRWESRR